VDFGGDTQINFTLFAQSLTTQEALAEHISVGNYLLRHQGYHAGSRYSFKREYICIFHYIVL
jgi:hypothetical protein